MSITSQYLHKYLRIPKLIFPGNHLARQIFDIYKFGYYWAGR